MNSATTLVTSHNTAGLLFPLSLYSKIHQLSFTSLLAVLAVAWTSGVIISQGASYLHPTPAGNGTTLNAGNSIAGSTTTTNTTALTAGMGGVESYYNSQYQPVDITAASTGGSYASMLTGLTGRVDVTIAPATTTTTTSWGGVNSGVHGGWLEALTIIVFTFNCHQQAVPVHGGTRAGSRGAMRSWVLVLTVLVCWLCGARFFGDLLFGVLEGCCWDP
jgi:amino acid permease